MTTITLMRSNRIKASLFQQEKTIAAKRDDEGNVLETLTVPAGHYAVIDGKDVYDVDRKAFEYRFIKIGDRYAELSKRFEANYEDGSFTALGRTISVRRMLSETVWCDADGGPLAFGTDGLTTVLENALKRGPVAYGVVEAIGDMRMRLDDIDEADAASFDELYAKDIEVVESSENAELENLSRMLREKGVGAILMGRRR